MEPIVLDASITSNQRSAECSKKGRVTQKKVEEFLELLLNLPIHIEAVVAQRAFSNIRKLADVHRLTSYDAAYLDLAIRRGLPLASLDDDLKNAAIASGVRLI